MIKTITLAVFVLFCFTLYSNKLFGQSAEVTNRYTLDFQFTDSTGLGAWQLDSKSFLPCLKDTALFNGKHPLGITRMYIKKYANAPLEAYLRQNIPMCATDAKEGSLSITLKTCNMVKAELMVSGINQLETVLYTHRIPILNDNTWSTYTSRFPLKDVALLNVSINLLGGEDSLRQVVWFDRLELKVDGNKLEVCDDNPRFSYPPLSALTTYPLSLSEADTYRNIPDIRQHSILALGESVHGSQTMNTIGFDFMKYCIEKEGARLALMELSLEGMLAVNRYIQGDEHFKLDDILKNYEQSLFWNKTLSNFLNWLKAYNRGKKEKVWFLGFDISNDFTRPLELVDYFQTINQTAQSPVLDSLCVGLLKKRPFDEMAEIIRTEPAIKNLFSETEYQIVLYCFTRSVNDLKTYTTRNSPRDYIMFQNANFLINAICENQKKSVIYAHFGHANYTTQHPAYFENVSFGSYMKKAYPDYFCIGLFAGEGKYLSRLGSLESGFTVNTLPKRIPSCLENSLLQHPNDYFYVSSPPSQLVLLRKIGNTKRSHPYEAVNLAQRVGGLLFIKQNEAIELDKTRIGVQHNALLWLQKQKEFRNKYPGIFK